MRQRDEDHFLDQRALEGVDRLLDEIAAVVGRLDRHAGRKPRGKLCKLRLDPLDHLLSVLAIPHDDDPAGDLSLAVDVEEPAA